MDASGTAEITALLYGGVGALLLLALALVAFVLTYQKKLVRQQLALHRLQLNYQRDLLGASLRAEEQERARIGGELHDGVGSALSAAKLLLGQLAGTAPADGKQQRLLATVEGVLTTSLQDIRTISRNLHPAVLTRVGLAEAVRNLGQLYDEALPGGVRVAAELPTALPYEQELALYRIVQELIANALRHAQPSFVAVRLHQAGPLLRLHVADDGRGFAYVARAPATGSGLGLKNLEARVLLLNATLHIDTAPGQGTRVTVEMPL